MKKLFQSLTAALGLILTPMMVSAEVSPTVVEGATTVSVEDAYTLFDQGVVFVDVRKGSDVDAGRVPGAAHLDVKTNFTPESLGGVVAKSDPVVFYCNGHSCLRSAKATGLAVEWGYTSVYYMRDGYPAWETSDFPIE